MKAARTATIEVEGGGHAPMGVLGATALVAGSMIGSGVYLLPATFGAVGSISILGWLAATLAALAIAGLFAALGAAVPGARGLAGYVQAGLGRFAGVVTTVIYWSLCWFGNVAIALAVAGYAGYLAPALAPAGPRLAVTLAVIWLSVLACWLGPRVVARVEGLTLALGLAPILLAGTFGWLAFHPQVFTASWNPQGKGLLEAARGAGLVAFWAFLGVESAAAVAAVVRDPARNVARATFGGVVAAAAVYISACAALMGMLPAGELARSNAPFADAAQVLLGVGGGALIAFCALARAAGALTAWTLIVSETTRSAADEGVFFRFFRTRPGERASLVNLATSGVLMSGVALATASPTLGDQFGRLTNVAVILSLYAYILAGGSLIRLTRRPGPVALAVAGMAASALLVAAASRAELLWSLVFVAAGALAYLPLRRGAA
jgi:arginine:agmatine antiporter